MWIESVNQSSYLNFPFQSKAIIPVVEVEAAEPPREISEDEAKFSAYQTLRKARAHKRLHKVSNTASNFIDFLRSV